jgi:hypothetical protein
MKTLVSFFVAAFLFASVTVSAQDQKSVFENAILEKAANGTPCVKLNWKKGSENTAYYLIERSTDGKAFKTIALVFTSEDEKFCDYKFNDKTFASAGNTAYYRVTIVNDHKELTYLPVKKVDLSSTSFSASPVATDALASNK